MTELFTGLGFNILKSFVLEGYGFDYYFLLEKGELPGCHSDIQRALRERGEALT